MKQDTKQESCARCTSSYPLRTDPIEGAAGWSGCSADLIFLVALLFSFMDGRPLGGFSLGGRFAAPPLVFDIHIQFLRRHLHAAIQVTHYVLGPLVLHWDHTNAVDPDLVTLRCHN